MKKEIRMKDNVIYPARLENLVLLDGKDLDVSEIEEEIRKDCRRLLFGYIFCDVFCIGFLTCMIAFRGICATCDNVIRSSSKGGIYHAYHCTTELGEHSIAFVNGYRRRADIGDDIMYVRILNHDFIYKV